MPRVGRGQSGAGWARDGRIVPMRMLRALVVLLSALLVLAACTGDSEPEANPDDSAEPTATPTFASDFNELEEQYEATLGVYAVDTETGQTVMHNAQERFAFASTVKALAVGALLYEQPQDVLEQTVELDESTVVDFSPEIEEALENGETELTVREVADAAVRYSDNTAGNILFDLIGGPEELQGVLREIGDETTIVSRREPELNDWTPGDERDTTTPEALATSLRFFLFDEDVDGYDRAFLTDLMVRNTTGDDAIRAGVPEEWEVADKTGAAAYGTRNDIGVLRRAGGAPIVLAIMSHRDEPDAEFDDDLIADATRIVVESFTR